MKENSAVLWIYFSSSIILYIFKIVWRLMLTYNSRVGILHNGNVLPRHLPLHSFTYICIIFLLQIKLVCLSVSPIWVCLFGFCALPTHSISQSIYDTSLCFYCCGSFAFLLYFFIYLRIGLLEDFRRGRGKVCPVDFT